MYNYWWILIIFVLVILPTIKDRRQTVVRKHIKKRKQKGTIPMNEIVKSYIDKDCVIYISGGSSNTVTGIIRKVEDNWVQLEKENKQTELISLDYVSRIQEYPLNKNGKKKVVW